MIFIFIPLSVGFNHRYSIHKVNGSSMKKHDRNCDLENSPSHFYKSLFWVHDLKTVEKYIDKSCDKGKNFL